MNEADSPDKRARAARPDPLQQTSAALRLSEARLRAVFESAHEAIVMADGSQHIVMANAAAARMFACPLEQMIGAPLNRFVPERFHDQHRRDIEAFAAGPSIARRMAMSGDIIGRRADGEEFPVDASISHLRVDGQPLFTAVLRDVGEQRRAQLALRESESRIRQLLAMLPDAVLVTDGERIVYVNQAASRLFGRPAHELIGCTPIELSHPQSRELVRARHETMRRGAAAVPVAEVKIVRADGTVRIIESSAARITESTGLTIIVVLRDVTELRQAQAELATSHRDLRRLVAAQEAVREDERRRIARELHDDLQQALAAIRLDLATLAAQLPVHPEQVPQMLDSLDRLVGAALQSTRRIVNDLRPRVLDDLGLGAALEVLASQFAQRTGVACRLEVGARVEGQQDIVGAPATCLYRVAQEALQNVAKHAQATEVVLALDIAPGPCIALRITDNGTGMVDSDRRKPETFGLLGMDERVQALGGRLQVTGQPGRGTRVDVEIPAPGLADAA